MPFDIDADVSFAIRSFRFNEATYQELLRGPVSRDLARRAIRVEGTSKQYATGVGGGPNVRTGRLRNSITWRLGEDERGPYADIGSNVLYSVFVEEGTSKMRARPYLRPALQSARD